MKSISLEQKTQASTLKDLKLLLDFALVPSGTYRFVKRANSNNIGDYIGAIFHDLIKLSAEAVLLYDLGRNIIQ